MMSTLHLLTEENQQLREENRKLFCAALFLFWKLDEIETLSEIADDDDRWFRQRALRAAARRSAVGTVNGARIEFHDRKEAAKSAA